MLDWLNTGLGTIGVLGVLVTVLSWHGGRQTKAILHEQSRILERMDRGTKDLLAQMEANAEARYRDLKGRLGGEEGPHG
jgi:hypothetical protein